MALLPWNWLIHHSRRTCLVLRTKFVSPYGPICHPSINNRRLIWRKDRICSRATNNALHVRSPYQVVNEVRDHATLTAGATSCPSHAKCKRWSEAKKKTTPTVRSLWKRALFLLRAFLCFVFQCTIHKFFTWRAPHEQTMFSFNCFKWSSIHRGYAMG